MYTIKIANPVKDIYIKSIEESGLSKELVKEKLGDIYSGWKDWEIELPLEHKMQLAKIPILEKRASDLLIERNKLIVERDARPNITNKEWIEKQNEVRDLTDELKEVKVMCDKLLSLCFKLTEKISTEKKSSSFREKMERIELVLKTLVVPASIIVEILKKSNKAGS
ncbi:MAG: hypothetical protein I3273_07010 [Candidatus Moeniiplasma glomeromycotorum]|nr:hypothetical protein [Candidatus Moeniiplasma glomeromycotorum]MCE8168289.1 hypothetical protein [Candidatus Moeniiplasma glomeromycotorum]MCE8169836.1 hypothetical protein [Candidatus Moeniiplasma glomeromycotorum]